MNKDVISDLGAKQDQQIINSNAQTTKRKNEDEYKESKLESKNNNVNVSKVNKNILKTNTLKHDNKDFNVKAKIQRMQTSIQQNYRVVSKLGHGSFGTVYKVYHKLTQQTRAMKIIKKDTLLLQDDDHKFLKEIEILKEIDHMNIIKIYEYYEDNDNYYLITEYISGGELYDTIIKWSFFDEINAKKIFRQIISAVAYMHNENIIHRDLKPENILVDSDKGDEITIKLIDFGTSNYFEKNKKLKLQVGSPYYIAPEVLEGNYNEKCDIWSCGCILYVMLVGYPPFEANSTDELLKKVKKGKYDLSGDDWEYVSLEAKDLIKRMLEKKPSERISANEILKHSWMKLDVKPRTKDMKIVLNRIKNFNVKDKLQQATMSYIVHFLTPPTEFEKMRKIFMSLDQNGDGTLSISELEIGLEKIYGKGTGSVEVKSILSEMDSDNSGSISYEEFLTAVGNKTNLINENNLKLCFQAFDLNNDGTLSIYEIRDALGAKDNDYVKNLMSLIDSNGNNEIDFDEFKNLMNVLLNNTMKITNSPQKNK